MKMQAQYVRVRATLAALDAVSGEGAASVAMLLDGATQLSVNAAAAVRWSPARVYARTLQAGQACLWDPRGGQGGQGWWGTAPDHASGCAHLAERGGAPTAPHFCRRRALVTRARPLSCRTRAHLWVQLQIYTRGQVLARFKYVP